MRPTHEAEESGVVGRPGHLGDRRDFVVDAVKARRTHVAEGHLQSCRLERLSVGFAPARARVRVCVFVCLCVCVCVLHTFCVWAM